MPSYTERQRRFMGAEYGRKKKGQQTATGMSESQLRDFARKPLAKRRGARRSQTSRR
jgi:hypothetical protein